MPPYERLAHEETRMLGNYPGRVTVVREEGGGHNWNQTAGFHGVNSYVKIVGSSGM